MSEDRPCCPSRPAVAIGRDAHLLPLSISTQAARKRLGALEGSITLMIAGSGSTAISWLRTLAGVRCSLEVLLLVHGLPRCELATMQTQRPPSPKKNVQCENRCACMLRPRFQTLEHLQASTPQKRPRPRLLMQAWMQGPSSMIQNRRGASEIGPFSHTAVSCTTTVAVGLKWERLEVSYKSERGGCSALAIQDPKGRSASRLVYEQGLANSVWSHSVSSHNSAGCCLTPRSSPGKDFQLQYLDWPWQSCVCSL